MVSTVCNPILRINKPGRVRKTNNYLRPKSWAEFHQTRKDNDCSKFVVFDRGCHIVGNLRGGGWVGDGSEGALILPAPILPEEFARFGLGALPRIIHFPEGLETIQNNATVLSTNDEPLGSLDKTISAFERIPGMTKLNPGTQKRAQRRVQRIHV